MTARVATLRVEYLNICAIENMEATPEQLDHARKVLTRLATLS